LLKALIISPAASIGVSHFFDETIQLITGLEHSINAYGQMGMSYNHPQLGILIHQPIELSDRLSMLFHRVYGALVSDIQDNIQLVV
jgi:hypothetical protein